MDLAPSVSPQHDAAPSCWRIRLYKGKFYKFLPNKKVYMKSEYDSLFVAFLPQLLNIFSSIILNPNKIN